MSFGIWCLIVSQVSMIMWIVDLQNRVSKLAKIQLRLLGIIEKHGNILSRKETP